MDRRVRLELGLRAGSLTFGRAETVLASTDAGENALAGLVGGSGIASSPPRNFAQRDPPMILGEPRAKRA